MQLGKVCAAPGSYNGHVLAALARISIPLHMCNETGPCDHTAYMGAATAADKKAFEATALAASSTPHKVDV